MRVGNAHSAQLGHLDRALFPTGDGGADGAGDHLFFPEGFRVFRFVFHAVLQAQDGRDFVGKGFERFDHIIRVESFDCGDDQIDIIMTRESFFRAAVSIEAFQVVHFTVYIFDAHTVFFKVSDEPRLFHINQRITDQRQTPRDIRADGSRSKT